MTLRVLVVEDTEDLRDELLDYLSLQGYEVQGVGSLAAMWRALAEGHWQVLVMDLGLPDGDGAEATAAIRRQYGLKLGIVMATARGQTEQRINGLRVGADAYLVKPIDPRELDAVIHRVGTRLHGGAASSMWVLLREQHSLQCPNGVKVDLTGSEFLTLDRLIANRGQPVPRVDLENLYSPGSADIDVRRLDTLISRLRTKVRQTAGLDLPLRTHRNQGYSFPQGE
jgi:DNA-binding response OmpR family regulator